MTTALTNAVLFLVQTLFELYLFVLMLRLLLEWVGVQRYNSVSQVVIKLTNVSILPFQRFLPIIRGFDTAVLLVLILLEIVKLTIIVWLSAETLINPLGLIIWLSADLLTMLINLFFYAILITAILSWIHTTRQHPIVQVLYSLTEPLLRPIRRLIPPISGFDLSPIAIMILLKLTVIVLMMPLQEIGVSMSLGHY